MSQLPENWNCEEIRQHLEIFLDGKLPETAAIQIQSHLEDCPGCAAQTRLARDIHNELRVLPEFDTPAPVLQQILDQTVRTESPPNASVSFWGRWPGPVWAALAATGLALLLGVGVLNQQSTDPVEPDAAAIAQATAEARYALARTGLLTRKAGLVIRDKTLRDRIAAPTSRGLSRALHNPVEEKGGASLEGVNDV